MVATIFICHNAHAILSCPKILLSLQWYITLSHYFNDIQIASDNYIIKWVSDFLRHWKFDSFALSIQPYDFENYLYLLYLSHVCYRDMANVKRLLPGYHDNPEFIWEAEPSLPLKMEVMCC